MDTKGTIESRNIGFTILIALEELKNRLKNEGHDDDADTVRVAIINISDLFQPSVPTYRIHKPENGWKKADTFTDEEKKKLRSIAETIAMLDGNAFFGNEVDEGREWYEMYLSEAHAIWEANGGDDGWAGNSSMLQNKST